MPTYRPTLEILSRMTANKLFFKDGLISIGKIFPKAGESQENEISYMF